MIKSDSIYVLADLVRSGIWSKVDDLSRYRHVILDADSIVSHLFRYCVSEHLRRQAVKLHLDQLDLVAATIVDYAEFGHQLERLFDFFEELRISALIVYAGKSIEATALGLTAACFNENSQVAVNNLKFSGGAGGGAANGGNPNEQTISQLVAHINRPNLALNVFKAVVNKRRRAAANSNVSPIQLTYQAIYSAHPVMAKLARDFRCPVLTNDVEFILFDVRAGFILFEAFWKELVREGPRRSSSSLSISTNITSPSSRLSQQSQQQQQQQLKSSLSLQRSRSASRIVAPPSVRYRMQLNRLFLRQHPGLRPEQALHLFILTSNEFISKYSASLKRMGILKKEPRPEDLNSQLELSSTRHRQKYHRAAERLEAALAYLCGKSISVLASMIRSESARSSLLFGQEYRALFEAYAVCFDFKARLSHVLKQQVKQTQLAFIERCLVATELTADFFLPLVCCTIGQKANLSYNKFMQFEDLTTRNSAYSINNRTRSILMSILLGSNRAHDRVEKSKLSSTNRTTSPKSRNSSSGSLTIIDRNYSKLMELAIPMSFNDKELDEIRDKLTLTSLNQGKASRQDRLKLINFVFHSSDITKFDNDLERAVSRHLPATANDESRVQLAISLSLFKSALIEAAREDAKFKSTYEPLSQHFQRALVAQFLFVRERVTKKKSSGLDGLRDSIIKNRLDCVALAQEFVRRKSISRIGSNNNSNPPKANSSSSNNSSSSSSSHSASNNNNNNTGSSSTSGSSTGNSMSRKKQPITENISRQIRHLIELHNSALENYSELNSFLDYPLPDLELYLYHNPILTYNLCLHAISGSIGSSGSALSKLPAHQDHRAPQ